MTTTQQPEALVFADDRPTSTSDDLYQWAIDAEDLIRAQHARIAELEDVADMAIKRIAELEAQLSAIGAGGVEPLRKSAAAPQAVHPENIREGAPYDNLEFKQLARAMGVWGTPQAALCAQFWLAATQPAAQGVELANCKGGKWLTVVYRDIQPGDESRTIGEHPKVSALSWSHALHDRDAAIAAQAKQGDAA